MLGYVPMSWLKKESVPSSDGTIKDVWWCSYPKEKSKDNDRIYTLVSSCSEPNREDWDLCVVHIKGRFHDMAAAEKELSRLRGLSETSEEEHPASNLKEIRASPNPSYLSKASRMEITKLLQEAERLQRGRIYFYHKFLLEHE